MDLDFITKWVEQNPMVFLMLFVVGGVTAMVISILSRSKKKKQRKEVLAKGGTAEVYFHEALMDAERVMMDGGHDYSKVYSVNGQKPNIIDHSLMVPAGPAVIDLERVQAGSGMGLRHTNKFPRTRFEYHFQENRKYIMDYNMIEKKYEIKEK